MCFEFCTKKRHAIRARRKKKVDLSGTDSTCISFGQISEGGVIVIFEDEVLICKYVITKRFEKKERKKFIFGVVNEKFIECRTSEKLFRRKPKEK